MSGLVITLWVILWVWAVPAILAEGALAVLVALVNLAGGVPWYVWLLLSPLLYLGWLICFLFFCAKTMQALGRRFPRPRRGTLPGSPPGRFRMVIASALRLALVESLPLVPLVQTAPWGRRLATLAYSPSLHIGSGVQISGKLEDPDLTELGDHVILGAGVSVAAHFWKALPDGRRLYITAPVKIRARATIGAYSTVTLGCSIGEDAIVEPHSYVAPNTDIPAGEVWSGRPASFQRKRSDLSEDASERQQRESATSGA